MTIDCFASGKRTTPRSLRLLLSVLLALGFAAFASVATQPSAHAASASCTAAYKGIDSNNFPMYDVPFGCSSVPIPGAHYCAVIGTSTTSAGTTQAIECTNLYVTDTSNATEMWGDGTFYCQGIYTQCLGMNVQVGFSTSREGSTFGSAQTKYGSYTCNPDVGACPDGGKATVGTQHVGGLVNTNEECYDSYSWDTQGDVISVVGAPAAFHSSSELDGPPSHNMDVCLQS